LVIVWGVARYRHYGNLPRVNVGDPKIRISQALFDGAEELHGSSKFNVSLKRKGKLHARKETFDFRLPFGETIQLSIIGASVCLLTFPFPTSKRNAAKRTRMLI